MEHWNGSRWAIMSAPSPNAADGLNELNAVSCPRTTSCFAVGETPNGVGFQTLVEHWNGSHWSVMTNHSPPGDAMLDGVSCPSTRSCFAVGDDDTRDGFSVKGLVEHWNGRGSWSVMLGTPSPTDDTLLVGVSCPSAASCFAVGYANKVVVERWTGRGSWSIMSSPNPDVQSILVGVSCPNMTTCVAVGSSVAFTDYGKSVVEQWNGSSWFSCPA